MYLSVAVLFLRKPEGSMRTLNTTRPEEYGSISDS